METIDRRGIKSISQSDSRGRQVSFSRSHPDLSGRYGTETVVLEQYVYDASDQNIESVDANLNRTSYVFDGANRKIAMTERLA